MGDTQPPVTSSSVDGTQGMAGWYVSPVTVALEPEGEDPENVSISYRISGGAWHNYTEPLTFSEDGIHLLEFFATDAMGEAERMRKREIKVDTTPPTTTLLVDGLLGEGGWYTSSVRAFPFPVDLTSGVRSLYFRLDGGPWTDIPPPLLLSSSGEHTLEFFAEDFAGNMEVPGSSRIRLDREAPDVVILQPQNGDVLRTSALDVEWSAQDEISGIGSCSATLDEELLSMDPPRSLQIRGLSEGVHELQVACLDEAGNRGEATMSFVVDESLPSFSIPLGPTLLALILVPAAGVVILLILRRRRKARRDAP